MRDYFKNHCFFCFVLLLLGNATVAQTSHQYLRKGDSDYLEKDFTAAEENYRKSLEEKATPKGTYNLGNSIYNQERFDEAIRHYSDVVESTGDKAVKSKAFHNLGNAYYGKKEFDKSIEAYKNALRLNSSDIETKRNLALAQKQLMQQKQQQQQQQEQEQKESDEQKDQQEKQQQQQKEQQDQPQEDQQQQQQEQEQQVEEKELSKEEARKLLEIMEEEEMKVQEKMRKQDSKPNKSDKDW